MKVPRAIICGMLEKEGKILFLEKDGKIEMPWIYGTLAGDPISAIGEAFRKKTDVKVDVGVVVLEGKQKIDGNEMPVLVLKVEPKDYEYEVVPADEFTAVWLTLDNAKKKEVLEHALWLKNEFIEV